MNPWTTACQASLSISNSRSLLKFMSIESVMPSNHLILYSPLLLPPSIFSSIRVFSNKSVLCIRWPEYWSFSFSISPSNEYSGPISFRMDWLDLLAVQGTLKSLKCKVKWALGSITTNKASGGDGIPVELFQILRDDALKVLHSICQQIWETQQWPQDWKRSVFISIPKKGDAKECSNYHTVALTSHASKVMLKILQTSLQQFMNHEFPYCFSSMLKLGQPLTPCLSLSPPPATSTHTHTHSLSFFGHNFYSYNNFHHLDGKAAGRAGMQDGKKKETTSSRMWGKCRKNTGKF